MKGIYLKFILCLLHCFCYAQNKTIDSLLNVLKTQKEDTNKVKTLKYLCWRYGNIGEYEKAISYANEGITLAQKLNFKKGLSRCYSEIGIIYMNQSNYPKALEYYTKALKINEDLGDKKGISICFGNIAIIYEHQSNYPKSLEFNNKALKVYEELGDKKGISNCFTNIGIIYDNQSNYPKALEYYAKALKINEDLGDKKGISNCFTNIGIIYENQSNYPKALEYYTKSLKIDEELGDKKGISNCFTNIGGLYYAQSNNPLALQYYTKALKIDEELGDKNGMGLVLVNTSQIYNELKKYSFAKEQTEQVISISNEIGEIDNMRLAYEELAKAEEGLGNYKAAYLSHKKFKELTDSIFNIENSKQLSDIKTNYEVGKKETELNAANKIEQAKKDVLIKKQKLLRNVFIIGFGLIFVFAVFIFRSYRQKQKANIIITKQKVEVEQQRNIVQHQNKEIISSIKYAKRIQATILPPLKVVKKYLDDSFVLYLPKDIVAGDFFWMDSIENITNKKETILFAACDCTGHGVPGALVSVVCSNALNRAVKEYNITQPSLILDKVAELVVKDFSKDENENVQDGMDVSLCALNIKTRELQWAGANNPLWIIRNGELLETKADKQPIGKMDNRKPFMNHEIELQKGDTIYLFTDGYADQFGGSLNKKYSKKAFRELVVKINTSTLIEQREALYNEHILWRGENEQVDDICVIGVKI